MSLNQYLQTDQYFSSTWDDTGNQAMTIVEAAGIPIELLPKINATVRVTLMEWHNNYWLHEFFLKVACATDDFEYVLITDEHLVNFIMNADDVLFGKQKMSSAFPYPSWWNKTGGRRQYSKDDKHLLEITRERFYQLVNQISHLDFVYQFSV